MSKDIKIFHEDEYKIFDMLKKSNTPGPKGWVKVYFNSVLDENKNVISGDLHHEGSNLVVAQGRTFVAQKIFQVDPTPNPDYRNYTVSHFAIGAGGASVTGTTVTLLGPEVCDTYLTTPIALAGGYLNEPSGYSGTTPFSATGAVKPITTDGSIVYESEAYNGGGGGGGCDYNTKVKCTCVVPDGEPSAISVGQSVPVNEAGLYFISGTTAKMFARICFAPKWKEKESTLTLVWYVLC